MVLLHLPQPHDRAHRLGVVAVRLGLGIDVLDVVGDRLFLFLQPLDTFDEQAKLVGMTYEGLVQIIIDEALK